MSGLHQRAATRAAFPRLGRARGFRLSMLAAWTAGAVLPWAALLFLFYLICD
ncbi:MAG TPA: hypothetical protein VJR47_13365 [Stellaceae bacterium]|nr:hypothetical protein [Stellaceae bacterium]